MSEITNTAAQQPIEHLAGAISMGGQEYLAHVEQRGQDELVASSLLPARARGLDNDGWREFEELGFVRGEQVPGDELFVRAELPAGWRREGSEHAMWSHIVDERGIKRVAVFYKAACYDRRAHMHICRPGAELSSDIIYGSDPVALPQQWALLTDGEKADFRADVDEYLHQAEQNPDIWGRLAPRAKALSELMKSESGR